MIKAFLPSKNRAMQAHCLFEMCEKQFGELFDFHVLVKTDNGEYRQGYELLKRSFPDFEYVDELNFQAQFEEMLQREGDGPICLFTDDCVVWRKTQVDEERIKRLLTDEQVWCVSLRLGLNTLVQNYLTGEKQIPFRQGEVVTLENTDFIAWNWRARPPQNHFGYPISWDATIYRASDLLSLSKTFTYKNPREFEAHLTCSNEHRAKIKPNIMISTKESCVCVNSVNEVQGDGVVPAGLWHLYSPIDLNYRYLAGKVIDVEAFSYGKVEYCHYEWPLTFKLYEEQLDG